MAHLKSDVDDLRGNAVWLAEGVGLTNAMSTIQSSA